MSTQLLVMRQGRVVERGPARDVFASPQHPYTRTLLASVPSPEVLRRRPEARRKGPSDDAP
jgi:oligopeptide/dipeptide ABC transporter ATP-binding protein